MAAAPHAGKRVGKVGAALTAVAVIATAICVASATKALDFQTVMAMNEAIWSLGILDRSAASAVPLLLSTFEATPEVRGWLAESLVEITRGTPNEDRVITSLASAWGTASQEQRAVFARSLRSLGLKS